MNTIERGRPDLPALTGLRFFAAIYVVIFHFAPQAWDAGAFGHFIGNGRASVELFFVLSGFILTYVHDQGGSAPTIERREFWFARFARIYPVYLLAFVVSAPFVWQYMLAWHGSAKAAGYMVLYGTASVTLLQAWVPRLALAWNLPSWSLSAEAFFYACFPFIIARVHRLTLRQALALGVALWACTVIPLAVLFLLPARMQARDSVALIPEYLPLLRIAEFIGGVLLARVFLQCRRLPGRLADALSLVMAALIVLTLVCCGRLVSTALLFPGVLLLIFFLAQAEGAFCRLIGSAPVKLLGEASYSMYILHYPIYMLFLVLFSRGLTTGALTASEFDIYIPTVIVVSIVVFKFFERPAAMRLKQWWRSRTVDVKAHGAPDQARPTTPGLSGIAHSDSSDFLSSPLPDTPTSDAQAQ
jgi:peptidoglycan/LPS O-acetylase OafA/YrhL